MFQENVNLKTYTTLKVGGDAAYFTVVQSENELVAAVREAKKKNLLIRVLGGGSNLFVPDEGFSGLVIKNEIKGISDETTDDIVRLTAGAGEVFDDVVSYAVKNEYWGIENLSYIPGSVGAAPIQNIGAYGSEVKDTIETVRVFDVQTESFYSLSNEQCQFSYRNSLFKSEEGAKYIVVSVAFFLNTTARPNVEYRDLAIYFEDNPCPTLHEVRDAVISVRSKKFPDWTVIGTAGSFFKNPIIGTDAFIQLRAQYPEIPGFEMENGLVKVPLGWVLDKVCNVRGLSIGHVGSYGGQALVLVNDGNATAAEVKSFADYVTDLVYQKTNIKIEWEVTRLC